MVVIIFAVTAVTIVMLAHVYVKMPLEAIDLAGMSLIAGLGGFHSYKQGQVDTAIANDKPVK